MRVDLDESRLASRLEQRLNVAQALIDQQAMKDSNLFAPEDVGTLQDSVLLGSRPGTGVLVWDVSYAKNQYYENPNKSKDKNPRAQMKWFEVAKSLYLKRWVKVAQDGYNR
jgi:hypothetical protein